MHILFLTHYFPPEVNAPASRTYENVTRWVKHDDVEVTVVTNNPNHPSGALFPGHTNNWLKRETVDDVNVLRVKTYLAANAGVVKRTLNYLFFMFMAIINSTRVKDVDLVIATSPQFFCAVAGFIVSIVKNAKYIFELRDLWPESIVTVGAMRGNFALKMLEKLELRLYHKAVAVIALTQPFKDNLIARGIEPDKIHVITNGVDLEFFKPIPRNEALVEENALRGKKIVSYIGTLGMAHALDSIVLAAEVIKDNNDIVILLIGDGAKRQEIIEMIDKKRLNNIRILPQVPKDKVLQYYSITDLGLVTLRDQPLFDTVLPSKLLEMMGCGLPVLGCLRGYSCNLLTESGGGKCIAPESPDILAKSIVNMVEDEEFLISAADRAREYIKINFNRDVLAKDFLEILQSIEGCADMRLKLNQGPKA